MFWRILTSLDDGIRSGVWLIGFIGVQLCKSGTCTAELQLPRAASNLQHVRQERRMTPASPEYHCQQICRS
jgi:hypothetical protein